MGALGGYYAYQQWNKPHRDVEQAEAGKSVDATALYEQFSSDEAAANEKYLDQIVRVCGLATSVSEGDGDAQITIQLATGGMGVILCSSIRKNIPIFLPELRKDSRSALRHLHRIPDGCGAGSLRPCAITEA
ncbi:MAG: hypothetical protein IPH16_16035 [Haliscomenobacter sp.]|nr:hypothetical protein [Haliscomenobacter sp.]